MSAGVVEVGGTGAGGGAVRASDGGTGFAPGGLAVPGSAGPAACARTALAGAASAGALAPAPGDALTPASARPTANALPARFRDAMAVFPSGVTIITTVDRAGQAWGFTASSFCSLSLSPPLMLVCLARTARCHPAFLHSDDWAVHIVGPRHIDLVTRFATRGADKFGGGEFTPDSRGVPVLPDAPVTLLCTAHARHDGGDHIILVGNVHAVTLRDEQTLFYARRTLHPAPSAG